MKGKEKRSGKKEAAKPNRLAKKLAKNATLLVDPNSGKIRVIFYSQADAILIAAKYNTKIKS